MTINFFYNELNENHMLYIPSSTKHFFILQYIINL